MHPEIDIHGTMVRRVYPAVLPVVTSIVERFDAITPIIYIVKTRRRLHVLIKAMLVESPRGTRLHLGWQCKERVRPICPEQF